MKNTIDIIRRQGLRLFFCAIVVPFCANIYAQDVDDDTFDDDAVEFRSAADIINEIKNSGFTMYGSDGNIIE